jgi:hypothetical protein
LILVQICAVTGFPAETVLRLSVVWVRERKPDGSCDLLLRNLARNRQIYSFFDLCRSLLMGLTHEIRSS